MNNKVVIAATTISLLLISFVGGILSVEVAKANPYMFYREVNPIPGATPPQITIISPRNSTVCNANTAINFNITTPLTPKGSGKIYWIRCNLDGTEIYFNAAKIPQPFNFSQNFNLTQGQHNMTVKVGAVFFPGDMTIFYLDSSSSVFFSADTTPPSITVLSLENKTYSLNTLPLEFKVNEKLVWTGFSLDHQDNMTIAGNATLTGLLDGTHSVVIYANDTAGNMGKSDIVEFTCQPTPEPTVSPSASPTTEPSPTLDDIQAQNHTPELAILSLAGVAVAASLLSYLTKHQK